MFVSFTDPEMVMSAFILPQFDYYNTFLTGLTQNVISCLQSLLKATGRFLADGICLASCRLSLLVDCEFYW